jgi:hypothetical protein
LFCFKHSPCRNVILCVFLHFKYYKTGFGGLLCLQWEAAWKVQNKEKKLTLVTLGGIKFIWTSSSPPTPHPPSLLQLLPRFLGHSSKNYVEHCMNFLCNKIFYLNYFQDKIIFRLCCYFCGKNKCCIKIKLSN